MEQEKTRESAQNKRLREMFRRFQRHNKKQKEKTKERRSGEVAISPRRKRSSSASNKRNNSSSTPRRSRSKNRKRRTFSPATRKGSTEETTTADESEGQDESSSAKKRRLIRKKYGINVKDEDFFQSENKEDIEEFENVAVALRPAATKMRKAKLKWKVMSPTKEKEKETVVIETSTDLSVGTGRSWDEPTAEEKAEKLAEKEKTESSAEKEKTEKSAEKEKTESSAEKEKTEKSAEMEKPEKGPESDVAEKAAEKEKVTEKEAVEKVAEKDNIEKETEKEKKKETGNEKTENQPGREKTTEKETVEKTVEVEKAGKEAEKEKPGEATEKDKTEKKAEKKAERAVDKGEVERGAEKENAGKAAEKGTAGNAAGKAAEKVDVDQPEPTQSISEDDRMLSVKYAEKFAKLKIKPKENVEHLLKETYELFLRVDELEHAEKEYLKQIKKLANELELKDKKLEELSRTTLPVTNSASATSTTPSEKENEEKAEQAPSEDEKISAQLEAVALRGLDIMKRNQILEHAVNEKESETLCSFFEAEDAKPEKTVVMLIDKALNYGVEVLLMRPDLFEDHVDNELRLFLLDTVKAKRALLDCMLLHPEYVPIAWGGNVLAKRAQEFKAKLEEKKVREKKAEESAMARTTRSIMGFLFGCAPEKSLEDTTKSVRETKSCYEVGKDTKVGVERKDISEYKDNDKSVNDKSGGSEDKSTWESGSAKKPGRKPIRYKRSKKYWRYRATGRPKTTADAAWVQDHTRQSHSRSKSRKKERSKKIH